MSSNDDENYLSQISETYNSILKHYDKPTFKYEINKWASFLGLCEAR